MPFVLPFLAYAAMLSCAPVADATPQPTPCFGGNHGGAQPLIPEAHRWTGASASLDTRTTRHTPPRGSAKVCCHHPSARVPKPLRVPKAARVPKSARVPNLSECPKLSECPVARVLKTTIVLSDSLRSSSGLLTQPPVCGILFIMLLVQARCSRVHRPRGKFVAARSYGCACLLSGATAPGRRLSLI